MAPVKIILVVLGFLCELLAIYQPPVAPRVNLVAAGLGLLVRVDSVSVVVARP